MRIGVSCYSFNRYFKDPSYTLAKAVKSAAQIGFEGFEMLPQFFKDKKGSPAACKELKKMLADAALEIACYTLGNDFGLPEGPARRAEIDGIKREIDNAVVLGAKVCRIESSWGGPKEGEPVAFDEMTDRVVRATKEVADHALKLGVRLGLENHGRYMGSYQACAMLIREVKSDAYGAVPDIGNFFVVDEDPLVAVRELAKYTVHVHAKDFLRRPPGDSPGPGWWKSNGGWWNQGAVVGEGNVPVKACLEALQKKGYSGWLAVEHESPEDPVEGLKRSRANLERMLSELA